jgi:excisionase family DNA binding protein
MRHKVLDLDQTATLVNCSPRQIQRLIARGEGPPTVDLGCRRLRFRRCDVEEWLEGRVSRPASATVPRARSKNLAPPDCDEESRCR